MKKAKTTLLYLLLAVLAIGDDISVNQLTGIWWGTAIDPEYGTDNQTEHWIIERNADGTYRVQEFIVDHVKKLYFLATEKPFIGRWHIEGALLTHVLDNNNHQEVDKIQFDGKIVKWERPTQVGLLHRYQILLNEESIESFEPKLGQGYRLVSEEDFVTRPDTISDQKNDQTDNPFSTTAHPTDPKDSQPKIEVKFFSISKGTEELSFDWLEQPSPSN